MHVKLFIFRFDKNLLLKFMKKFLLISALLTTISCTHQNQKIKFAFHSNVERSAIGNNKIVELKVFDDRLDKSNIGFKKFSEEKIEISSEQNLAKFLEEKIAADLVQKGFKIGKGQVVEMRIETLKYKAESAFPIGNSKANAAIKVRVRNDENRNEFNRNYQLDLANKHFIAPLESTDEETINSLLQEITANILNDEEFLRILAQ